MNSAHCKVEFGVEIADPLRLADALQIPAVFRCKQRSVCAGLEPVCAAPLHRPRVTHHFDNNEDSKQLNPLSSYLTHLHFCI